MSLNLAFFGLEQNPFNPTPDPRFLYLSPGHREGLAQLLYGVQEHKGFILLTGEIGTGKTTLLRTLLSRLDGNTASAFVFDTTLPFEGILEYMLEDFGVAKPGESHVQRLIALNNFLIERRRAGQNTVLILDEAQNLDLHALEQIRLLSNFETPTEKLLQILLVGQPELLDKLDRPELRQLKQRIGLRCRILPLTPAADPRLHPHPAPGRRGERPRALLRCGDDADRRVLGRNPAPHQHALRPLPAHRLCGPDPAHRSPDRRGGHRIFRAWRAARRSPGVCSAPGAGRWFAGPCPPPVRCCWSARRR